jgi:hypothetical protein
MAEPDAEQVKEILERHGMSQLWPVQLVARRLGCTVWRTRLYRKYGDANVQVQIYSFLDEPESIVDYAEEITALTSESESATSLVRDERDDDWGILVTCDQRDQAIVERALREHAEQEGPAYHPQLDRILGGDYFHELNGRWLKACLSSTQRAMLIKDLLEKATTAYDEGPDWPGKLQTPLPGLLVVLNIPAIPLEGPPDSYKDLALSHFVIESPEVIERLPAEGNGLKLFARQLFGFLGIEHRSGIGFCRDAGCCLRPEFLLRSGALTDVYFMVDLNTLDAPDEIKARDLLNTLLVTCEMTNDRELAIAALKEAASGYKATPRLDSDLERLTENAAEGFLGGNLQTIQALALQLV